jgi:hypothetical protein
LDDTVGKQSAGAVGSFSKMEKGEMASAISPFFYSLLTVIHVPENFYY